MALLLQSPLVWLPGIVAMAVYVHMCIDMHRCPLGPAKQEVQGRRAAQRLQRHCRVCCFALGLCRVCDIAVCAMALLLQSPVVWLPRIAAMAVCVCNGIVAAEPSGLVA